MTEPPDTLFLALNSGSSSLKLGLFQSTETDVALVAMGSAEGIGRKDGSLHLHSATGEVLVEQAPVLESQQQALTALVTALRQHLPAAPAAVGHRFVHGGPRLRTHQLLTPAVRTELERAQQFAPLHIPQALRLVDQAEALFPDVPQIVCFDTAFHRTLPPVAAHLPVPQALFDEGVQRYGFHGLSYESIAARLGPALPPRAAFAHLGNGSSLCAVRNGQSVDTTMGLTPTGGIPMSTRSGDLDPGVLLYLLRGKHATADTLEDMLDRHSGLAALSGGESDMQVLLERAAANDSTASLAVEVFCTAVTKTIGAYAALLGGLDLLVFTGGIGEHSAAVRDRICAPLSFLDLSHKVQVLPAEEEKQIARHSRKLFTAAR